MSSLESVETLRAQSAASRWYKNGSGAWMSKQLFFETSVTNGEEVRVIDPPFTLNREVEGKVCFRRTFVEMEDPTGYKWAMKYLNSWDHFNHLLKSHWFLREYERAVDELKTKLKIRSIEIIKEIAQGGSAQAYQANRYLASGEWEKAATGRGRPSKEEMKGELAKAVRQLSDEDQDAERIGLSSYAAPATKSLSVINGGKS